MYQKIDILEFLAFAMFIFTLLDVWTTIAALKHNKKNYEANVVVRYLIDRGIFIPVKAVSGLLLAVGIYYSHSLILGVVLVVGYLIVVANNIRIYSQT